MTFLLMVLTASKWIIAYVVAGCLLVVLTVLIWVLLARFVINPISSWRLRRHIEELTKSPYARKSPLDD